MFDTLITSREAFSDGICHISEDNLKKLPFKAIHANSGLNTWIYFRVHYICICKNYK